MDPHVTLSFDDFWRWLVTHPNCILRAGTLETVLHDDEDFHWHFASEGPGSYLVVQVLRGKRLVGELFIEPEQVTYVQGTPGDEEGEFVFQLISETETDRTGVYFFVMAHAYETEESFTPGRIH